MLSKLSTAYYMWRARHPAFGRGVPVLAYHKIALAPPGTLDPFLYDSPDRFDRQLAQLQAAGLTSTSLDTVVAPPADPPTRSVVITFDDGCRNVLDQGADLLARRGFGAIQFLVPGYFGGRNEWDIAKGDAPEPLMDVAQVRQWLARGFEIGSHSMTHRNLRHLAEPEAREEIAASKKKLEDTFAVPVRHFSYPYGSWNQRLADLVREAGYSSACTMDHGLNTPSTPPFSLLRIFPLSASDLVRKILHRVRSRAGNS